MTIKLSDADFIAAWRAGGGSPQRVAELTGLKIRNIYSRRANMANRGVVLQSVSANTSNPETEWSVSIPDKPSRQEIEIRDGVCIVFSDAHYWPGAASIGHRALVKLIKELKPRVVIANGDIIDGATISRHDKEGWVQLPSIRQEIGVSIERLAEIEKAAGPAKLIWNIGNHDARFERYIAMNASAIEGVPGTTLPEHFPFWTFSMSTMINPRQQHPVMVKHRYHNGIHATFNNTVKAGISIVTGHLHRLNVTAWGDYRGRRYGVDTGTLANPHGQQFKYAEDNPSPHGQGFAVLTFRDGDMLPPELVEIRGEHAYFRGRSVLEGVAIAA